MINGILLILQRRGSVWADVLSGVADINELTQEERNNIALELSSEFMEKGLHSDGEPNEYGLEIERLIDFCAPWQA